MKTRSKIIHIITGLAQGGAETVLYRLVSQMNHQRYENVIICLRGLDFYSDHFNQLGLKVYYLNLNYKNISWKFFKLMRILKDEKPDLVQTWMYHANFLGGLAAKCAGVSKILFSIRASGGSLKRLTDLINKLSGALSWSLPVKIITPSYVAAENHVKRGYDARKICVIPNGVIMPHLEKCIYLQSTSRVLTLGMLARYHPQKDYPNFLQAIAVINKFVGEERVRFLLAGRGVPESQELKDLSVNFRNVQLLPSFSDTSQFYQQLDIFVLSSAFGEAFPNVVAEAMSFGIPCVVTDVGDSRYIVGKTGRVVPPQDSKALAKACLELLRMPEQERLKLGEKSRLRVEELFSLDRMVMTYENLYAEILEVTHESR